MAENDDQDFLDLIQDKNIKEIVRKEINEVAFNDERFEKRFQQLKNRQNNANTIIQRPLHLTQFIGETAKDQVQDYEAELNPYKRDRNYQFIEPQRFKKIGQSYVNFNTVRRKPIFKMSDLYLPPNDNVQKMIDKLFKEKIHGRHSATADLQTHFDNNEELEKIFNNWQTKEDYDEFQNARNDLNQQELQQIVVNLGDKKENYFLFLKNTQEKKRIEAYEKQQIKNLPVANPKFLEDLRRQVAILQHKTKFVEEFQSDQESIHERNSSNKLSNNISQQKRNQNTSQSKLFGAMNFPIERLKSKFIQKLKDKNDNNNLINQPLVEQNIALDIKHQNQKSFNEELIKYYSYSNSEIVNQTYKGPIEKLNRIEYNLADPQFFLPKLHIALERHSDLKKVRQNEYKMQGGMGKANLNISQINKSRISDSLFTGNRQQFSKPSIMDGNGQRIYPLLQQEQQTLQKRIQVQMRNIYKEPLHHSQLALKFQLIHFTLDENAFDLYHRHRFTYNLDFKQKRKIQPIYQKQRKIKPKDLIINIEMKNSNIKYAKEESLSLAEGEFIMIQYIQEHPLVMSNPGMCERMFIQVNYQEMLEKINQDMITDAQIQDFEEMRDNPNNTNTINNGFEKKCELWRKNIKEKFGDNGKIFFWEPKMAGKLIGSPEGLGVALMESNLATYPIVKKKTENLQRDFLLVRQGDKWFLRKIQHMYVAGQVQPKKKIFNPDSRDYSIFKSTYEKAYIRRQIVKFGSVNFDIIKMAFKGESQASLKKALKSLRAISNDNKHYKIMDDFNINEYELTAEDVCLYQRMQKSICLLKEIGITQIRNNEKMKNVLKEFNKRYIQSLQKFTISRMIRDQLLLTSWYLTDSFSKFKLKVSKIEIEGWADPTNGRGGYSFVNKPQKQRTAKEDLEEKSQKAKVSGTTSDLRKLRAPNTRQFLLARGHNQEQLKGKGRWGLVNLVKRQADTQFARKERQTKLQKAQNQKRQISRVFNKMLNYLNDQDPPIVFNYTAKKKITLEQLMEKEKAVWAKTRERMQRASSNNQNYSGDQDQFQDEQ